MLEPNGYGKYIGLGSPHTAEQWANPNYYISGWQVVKSPMAGDIVAYARMSQGATGHVAIMVSSTESIGTSNRLGKVSITGFGGDKKFIPKGYKYVYRRYVGNTSTNNPYRAYP